MDRMSERGDLTRGPGGHLDRHGGHERRDVSIRAIAWAAAGLVALIVVTLATMYGLLDRLAAREARRSPPASPLAADYRPTAPPEPRLQERPIADLEALRAEEARLLGTYGWVDREQRTVRIPIERAMDLLADRAAGRTP
jgi:hypothetical protein